MIATQDDLHALSSSFSKLLKKGFGKGPETCNALYRGDILYVYMRNFMTPAEDILYANNQTTLNTQFRTSVMNSLAEELIEEASSLLGVTFTSFYQDWNYVANSGMFILISNDYNLDVKTDEKSSNEVIKVIEKVGSNYHKLPSAIQKLDSPANIYLVEAKDVLLPIESLLYKSGQTDFFLTKAVTIKKGYWEYKDILEQSFQRTIRDMFLMWDYNLNKHYLIFIFGRVNTLFP